MSKTKISIILGCMFSGKSTELVRRASRYRAMGISTLIINHINDTRTGLSVQTHSGTKLRAIKLDRLMTLFEQNSNLGNICGVLTVIAIDEAHFFPDLLEFVKEVEKYNNKIFLNAETNFKKNILTKDSTGKISNYQLEAEVIFVIKSTNKVIKIKEKKILDSKDDKFEEARYEKSIKQSFAYSISNKLITELIIN